MEQKTRMMEDEMIQKKIDRGASKLSIAILAFAIVYAGFGLTSVFAEAKFVMKGGTSVSQQVWHNILAEKWAEMITERSNGEVEVQSNCCAVLGSDNEMGEKTMMGGLQWYYTSTSNLARFIQEMFAFELPYLIQELDDNYKIFYENGTLGGPITEAIQEQLAKKNLHMLWVSGANFRATINSKREIRLPKDTEGLKLRVTASAVEREDVASWGGSPVPMAYGEVYTALQQGTIDGLGIGLAEAYPMKFYEVCKYAVKNYYNAYAPVILVNLEYWNKLPEEYQKLIRQASDDIVKWGSEHMPAEYNDLYEQKLAETGMKVYTPTEDEMKIWRDTTINAVWPQFVGKDISQEWLDLWKSRLGR